MKLISRSMDNCTTYVDVLSQIQRRVIVLGSNRADIGEPIAVVDIVWTLLLIDKYPGLALVGPVVGLQAMCGAEPGYSGIGMALTGQVLSQLEACCGLSPFGRPGVRTARDFVGGERVAAGSAIGNPGAQCGDVRLRLDADLSHLSPDLSGASLLRRQLTFHKGLACGVEAAEECGTAWIGWLWRAHYHAPFVNPDAIGDVHDTEQLIQNMRLIDQ